MSTPDAFAAPLQFDAVEPVQAAPAAGAILCSRCCTELRSVYHEVAGKVHCTPCRERAEARIAEAMARPGGLGRAVLFGIGGSVVGGVLYYGMTLTGWFIGPVAVLMGYAVAAAVRAGAGGRGGRSYQITALALTYLAIAMAYLPYAVKGMGEVDAATLVVACLLVVVKLPVVVAVADPLSVIFMGFGFYQAWRVAGQNAEGVLTQAPTVTGPHRIPQPVEA